MQGARGADPGARRRLQPAGRRRRARCRRGRDEAHARLRGVPGPRGRWCGPGLPGSRASLDHAGHPRPAGLSRHSGQRGRRRVHERGGALRQRVRRAHRGRGRERRRRALPARRAAGGSRLPLESVRRHHRDRCHLPPRSGVDTGARRSALPEGDGLEARDAAAVGAECRLHVQEPCRWRVGRAPHRGGRAQGPAGRRCHGLDAARQLHRERG